MALFSFLGFGSNKIKEALRRGAIIVDVRSPGEFDRGKIPESINIPVDRVPINLQRLKAMNRPLIFCCSSGDRADQAVRLLKRQGAMEVYNGGNWRRLLKIVNSRW